MVKVKCKVQVNYNHHGINAVVLLPVIAGTRENDECFKAIQSGSINLCIKDSELAEQFIVGQEVYVEFNFSKDGKN